MMVDSSNTKTSWSAKFLLVVLLMICATICQAAPVIFNYSLLFGPTGIENTIEGQYTVDGDQFADAIAASTTRFVQVSFFSLTENGVLQYQGPASAGSELTFLSGGDGPFSLDLTKPGLGLTVGAIRDAALGSTGCLTGTCGAVGLFNGELSTYTQSPVPEPASVTLALAGAAICIGGIWRKRRTREGWTR